MSTEGVGSRVMRAKSFELMPSLLTTGLGWERFASRKMRRALLIWLAVNPEIWLPGKVLEHTFDIFNFRSWTWAEIEKFLHSKALCFCLEGSGTFLIVYLRRKDTFEHGFWPGLF